MENGTGSAKKDFIREGSIREILNYINPHISFWDAAKFSLPAISLLIQLLDLDICAYSITYNTSHTRGTPFD